MNKKGKRKKYGQPSLRTYIISPPCCQDGATKETRRKRGRNTTKAQRRQHVPTRRTAQSESTRKIIQTKNSEKSEQHPRLHACKMIELTQDTSRQDEKRLKSPRSHDGRKTTHERRDNRNATREAYAITKDNKRESIVVEEKYANEVMAETKKKCEEMSESRFLRSRRMLGTADFQHTCDHRE